LEEDAGKMIHAGDMSLLDYNRAGYSLLEIVTDPDLDKPEEAEVLLHELRRLVRAMGVSDGNMEEGSLRCDANISLNTPGAGLGRKVEIKNLNSSRFVKKALYFEIGRQTILLDKGQKIIQETRLWNENRDQTESMRNKESANDYRYFPEPDLPAFYADATFLASLDALIVELPATRRRRLIEQHGITEAQADFVCDERPIADYFEATVALGADAGVVASWLSTDIQKVLNRTGLKLADSPLTAPRLVQLLKALGSGRIHSTMARQVMDKVFELNKDPEVIIKEEGLEIVRDDGALEKAVAEVLSEQTKAVADYRGGDGKVLGFLLGQVMRKTGGKMQPQDVGASLKKALEA
jgi:aspartyl-tRNA(Asn)/glutamyl-tRNA(Gln) amidotransferase subunit B